MIKYIVLLRGINISGKNKIPMSELKINFEYLGFKEVITYINSGNIIFLSNLQDKDMIAKKIKNMIKHKFDLDIPIFIITIDELASILNNAPDWWGTDNKEIYDNIIFIIPPTTYEDVFLEIGEANKKYEKIFNDNHAIFWSFNLKDYSKTNWIKTASSSINNKVTIRTANTMKKLLSLSNSLSEDNN